MNCMWHNAEIFDTNSLCMWREMCGGCGKDGGVSCLLWMYFSALPTFLKFYKLPTKISKISLVFEWMFLKYLSRLHSSCPKKVSSQAEKHLLLQ